MQSYAANQETEHNTNPPKTDSDLKFDKSQFIPSTKPFQGHGYLSVEVERDPLGGFGQLFGQSKISDRVGWVNKFGRWTTEQRDRIVMLAEPSSTLDILLQLDQRTASYYALM